MSHFSVLVITTPEQTVNELLAPYQENNMGDCPKQYLSFFDTTDEHMKEFKEDGVEMIKTPSGELVYPWNDMFRKPGSLGYGGADTHEVPEGQGFERLIIRNEERFPCFDTFMREYCGYKGKDPETGRYGHWENPNAKWDWYVVGGRWTGEMTVNGGKTDIAVFKDIDWETMERSRLRKAEADWKEAQADEDEVMRYFRYGIEKDQSREDYLRDCQLFYTFAVITPDGKWHERGSMGWWAVVSNENETKEEWAANFHERFLANRLPDETLTIVDCHI